LEPVEWVDQEVTISIGRRVQPGREDEYEAFLQGIAGAASRFEGYVGARVFRPVRGNRMYRIVLRFDSESNLRHFVDSEEQQAWRAIADELAEDAPFMVNITGTAQERSLALARAPFDSFVQTSISGIGMLLLGAGLALVLANSPLSDTYERFWTTELTINVGSYEISESLRHWVNDGLMALFFFIVGLEIKREVLVGELRYPRQAAFPIAAAVGGAIVPALLFSVINIGGDGAHGWGVPIGTDTAFSLGIISLFASRVRPLLLVFLTAFAIVDDILAVLVIALFYTDSISWPALGAAVALLVALVLANLAGVHRWPVYALLGFGVWLAVFESGIHGTIAGVLVAMTVPTRSWINPSEFLVRARNLIDDFERACYATARMLSNEPQQQATKALARITEDVETPLTHFQHQLNPWVAFGVLPLFAFANAGISFIDGLDEAFSQRVTLGVTAGLVLGKPLGITLFTWLAVKTGIALKSPAIEWRHVFGVAWLGGIGFTMSLFISELAFRGDANADAARIGILVGSLIAGTVGFFVLRRELPPPREENLRPSETQL
jgi:NhaA family Na+:H+ antiporter